MHCAALTADAMTPDWPACGKCGAALKPNASFCSRCGEELTAEEHSLACQVEAPEPINTPQDCLGCNQPIQLAQLLQPLYEFIVGDGSSKQAATEAQLARDAGKTLLAWTGAIEERVRRLKLGPAEHAALLADPVIAEYAWVALIESAAAPFWIGYRLPDCVVLDCPHCGRADPVGLQAAAQAGLAAIDRLPR